MSASEIFVALDQGGQSSRAIAFDGRGRELARSSRPVTTKRPLPGHVELDGEEIARGLWDALEEVLAKLGEAATRVERLGLATQRSTVALWSERDGELVMPCLSWQDRRGAQLLAGYEDQFDRIHALTGLFPSPHHGASKLGWALEHVLPAKSMALRGELRCGPLAAFLAGRLTDRPQGSVDPNNAGRTLLWNRHTRDWDPSLIQAFGLTGVLLPPCRDSEDEHGQVATSLGAIPLDLVLGDQPATLWSAGEPDPRCARVNLGTGAFCMRLAEAEAPEGARTARLLRSLAYSGPAGETWVVEGTVNGGASALNWLARTLHLTEEPSSLAERALATVPAPPVFLNSVSGLGSPDWRTDVEPQFLNLTGELGALEGVASVLESIVFLVVRNLVLLQTEGGELDRIVATGGLSRIDGLCQRLADLSRLPVERPPTVEATARGTAFLLAGRPEVWAEDDAPPDVFEPCEEGPRRDALVERYARLAGALDALGGSGSLRGT